MNNRDIEHYDIFIHSLEASTSGTNNKIPMILINEMIKHETIHNYIDLILESVFHMRKVEIIKYLLNCNLVNPFHVFDDDLTLFEKAIELKDEEIVNLMLTKYNLDVNTTNLEGIALVVKAVENNSPQISSLFILRNCNLNCLDSNYKSLLELCIEKKWFLHVNYILLNGYTRIYDDVGFFHQLCHLAIEVNSSLIFDKLVTNYFASKIQRRWRAWTLVKKEKNREN
jgi:hypothetical protein